MNIPHNFGPGRLKMPAIFARIDRDNDSLYSFARAAIQVVEYDRFLTGLKEEPVVGSLQLGVIWQHKSFELSYSQTFMTCQYEGQPNSDSYGSLNFSCYF